MTTNSTANMTAFVLGGSGEVGREVVRLLAENENFTNVTLIGRRMVDLKGEKFDKFQQIIIDFENLEQYADKFKGFDVGFSCLGTTRSKAGAKGFVRVDHDYVVETAKLANIGGCKQFHLVTSQGSDKNSWFLYPKVKGQVEEEISAMRFPRLAIYRPALLLCDRQESRPLEKVLQGAANLLDKWGKISIPTATVAQAMINNCFRISEKQIEIMENSDIHRLSKNVE